MNTVSTEPRLALVVANPDALQQGTAPRYSFDPAGGSIGSQGASWVLHDRAGWVQPQHCEIRFEDGGYIVIDRSGHTRLNEQTRPLGLHASARLRDADTVDIGNDRIDREPRLRAQQTAPYPPGAASGDFLRTPPVSPMGDKDRMLFDSVHHIDYDDDLQFQLRGHSLNPLVDAAQPLLGLVIRLRRLDRCDDIPRLYANVRDQITALSEEVRQLGYDGATQLAYRYALCAFIDEAVMATPWGHSSLWRERSLLSYHHNETWGGEKFFTVLARMQMEPEKYHHVLEFKYLCLCLGFQGKYGQQHNQQDTLNAIIVKLHRILRPLRGDAPERLTDAPTVATHRYRLKRQMPLWTPWAIALVVLVGAYLFFSIRLGATTDQVLQSLDHILKP